MHNSYFISIFKNELTITSFWHEDVNQIYVYIASSNIHAHKVEQVSQLFFSFPLLISSLVFKDKEKKAYVVL